MPQTLQPNTSESFAIKKEIESQILHIGIQLKKETLVSLYVHLLSKKLQLQQLLKQYSDES
jgi:hypothetical protein